MLRLQWSFITRLSGLHTTSSYRYQVGYQVPMVSIIKQIFYLVSHLIECAPGGLSSLYLRGLSIQVLKVFASFSLVYCFTLTTPCLNNFSITKYIIAFNYANVVAINLFLRDTCSSTQRIMELLHKRNKLSQGYLIRA